MDIDNPNNKDEYLKEIQTRLIALDVKVAELRKQMEPFELKALEEWKMQGWDLYCRYHRTPDEIKKACDELNRGIERRGRNKP